MVHSFLGKLLLKFKVLSLKIGLSLVKKLGILNMEPCTSANRLLVANHFALCAMLYGVGESPPISSALFPEAELVCCCDVGLQRRGQIRRQGPHRQNYNLRVQSRPARLKGR